MLQRDHLSSGIDNDFVGTHNIAHAKGVDCDLVFVPLGVSGGAANGEVGVRAGFKSGVAQHDGCAAGGVYFAGVVDLQNFHVGIGEGLHRSFDQIAHEGDPQRHIAGAEYGDHFGGLTDQRHVLLGLAGGGHHDRYVSGNGIVHQRLGGGAVGEVDDAVGGAGELLQAVVSHVYKACRFCALIAALHCLLYIGAHMSLGTVDQNFHGEHSFTIDRPVSIADRKKLPR